MKILLLDVNQFTKVEGRIFERGNYSFNMKDKVKILWSNGWCPVTQFKVDDYGRVYGRIANELVPTSYYTNVYIEMEDKTFNNRYTKAIKAFEDIIERMITEQQWIKSGYAVE